MKRKILLFGAGFFALLFILLLAFAFLLPYLVNLESVREKIEALRRWRIFRGDRVRRDREKKVGRNLKDECVATS